MLFEHRETPELGSGTATARLVILSIYYLFTVHFPARGRMDLQCARTPKKNLGLLFEITVKPNIMMVISDLKLTLSAFFMLEMIFSLHNSISGTLKSTFL